MIHKVTCSTLLFGVFEDFAKVPKIHKSSYFQKDHNIEIEEVRIRGNILNSAYTKKRKVFVVGLHSCRPFWVLPLTPLN